jgi:uncharacterized membrane protein YkvA (DUF1232 family)
MEERSMSNKSGKLMIPTRGGPMREFVNRLKLIGRLLADRRVNAFLKLLPIGALAYLFSPFDLDLALPVIGLLDDAGILWLGSYLFVELCPPEVVKEHTDALQGETPAAKDEVVDGEATELTNDKN